MITIYKNLDEDQPLQINDRNTETFKKDLIIKLAGNIFNADGLTSPDFLLNMYYGEVYDSWELHHQDWEQLSDKRGDDSFWELLDVFVDYCFGIEI